jgi:hypothetical protein
MNRFRCSNNGSKVPGSTIAAHESRSYRAQLLTNSVKPIITIPTIRITPKPPHFPDVRVGLSLLFGADLFGLSISIASTGIGVLHLTLHLHPEQETIGINLHQ